jgi:hypothetical protein
MKIIPFILLLLVIAVAITPGCVNNDSQFKSTVSDMAIAIKPDTVLLGKAFEDFDLSGANIHCRNIISIDNTYIIKISALEVSEKYRNPKKYILLALEKQKKGCQLILDGYATNDMVKYTINLKQANAYFTGSADDLNTASDLMPI